MDHAKRIHQVKRGAGSRCGQFLGVGQRQTALQAEELETPAREVETGLR